MLLWGFLFSTVSQWTQPLLVGRPIPILNIFRDAHLTLWPGNVNGRALYKWKMLFKTSLSFLLHTRTNVEMSRGGLEGWSSQRKKNCDGITKLPMFPSQWGKQGGKAPQRMAQMCPTSSSPPLFLHTYL